MTRDEFARISEAITYEKREVGEFSDDYAIIDSEWNRALRRCECILKQFIDEEGEENAV